MSKTTEAKEWTYNIIHHLASPSNALCFESIRSSFDRKIHGISATITYYYPSSKLFTKKDEISSKSLDITNVEKPLIDIIFLPHYYDKEFPYGFKNLNLDDKFLVECNSKKALSPDQTHYIKVELSIVNYKDFIILDPI